MVSFNSIPSNIRVPLFYAEVDPSKAGIPIRRQPALLVGTMIDTDGIATPNVPVAVGTLAVVGQLAGIGSELYQMTRAFFQANFAQETWILPMAEPVGGTAATGTLTVTTGPTEAGTYHLYIAGHHIGINVAAGETADAVASSVNAAINEDETLPVESTVATNVVTVTCKWKGVNGNDIRLEDNYYGKIGGEEMPIGMVVTYPAANHLATGAGTPVFTTAISNLGEQEFEYVALPFTDSTTLLAWETEYGFSDQGRWGYQRQHYGHLFSCKRDTYANLLVFGATRNAAQLSVMGIEVNVPSTTFEVTASYTGRASRSLTDDPARPLQTLTFLGLLPAKLHDRFNFDELNSLAGAGIATEKVGGDGLMMISRETTMAQLNAYGFSDDAYELVTTLATLARLIRNQRQMITSTFPRHKLANDGTKFSAGQAIVTPKIIKAALVAQYAIDEYNGLVENTQQFIRALIVERNQSDVNRIDVLFAPDLVNQLRIYAVLVQFRLQFGRRGPDELVAAAA